MRSSRTRPFPTPRGRDRPARSSGPPIRDAIRSATCGRCERWNSSAEFLLRAVADTADERGPREHAVGLGHRGDRIRKRRLPFAAWHVVPGGRHGAAITARPAIALIMPWCRTGYRSSCTRRPSSASRPPPIPGGTCEPPRPSGPTFTRSGRSGGGRPGGSGAAFHAGGRHAQRTCGNRLHRGRHPRARRGDLAAAPRHEALAASGRSGRAGGAVPRVAPDLVIVASRFLLVSSGSPEVSSTFTRSRSADSADRVGGCQSRLARFAAQN